MGTLNAILGQPDNEQISDKQRNYPSTLTQQDASSVQPVNDGLSDKQRNYPSTEHKETPVQLPSDEEKKKQPVVVTPSPAQSEPAAKRTMSYVEMMQQLSPYKPPTEEELAKERRKQKRETVLAAIGDGLNAFHLAYANQRGVKPLTTNASMSGKVRDRYEKWKKERDARTQEYLNAYLRAAKADDALEQQGVTNLLAKRRQDRLDKETKIKEDKAAAYQQYQASVTSKNEEQAAYWRAKWEALEAGKDADTALKEAKAAQARAAARLANVRADAGGFSNTAGAGMGEYTTTTVVERDKRGRETGRKTTRKRVLPGNGENDDNGGGSLLPK